VRARSLERLRAGSSSDAKMAMMAMTTSNSIKVNAAAGPFVETIAGIRACVVMVIQL